MNRVLSGLRAWVVQRMSAVYLALFVIYVALHTLLAPPGDYGAWRQWIGEPGMLLAVSLAYVALLLHAWVGIRDVVLDYIHPFILRLFVLFAIALFLVGCGLWAGLVLLKVVLV
ncbi:MAG: succinate dehydrogenase, hydrophobic membrane anchor protein [Gammaproteobacteria bacterium]